MIPAILFTTQQTTFTSRDNLVAIDSILLSTKLEFDVLAFIFKTVQFAVQVNCHGQNMYRIA